MDTISKIMTHLMTFCAHAGGMVLILGMMGYHKGILNNMDPLGATIDNFGLFGISVTLFVGAALFWAFRWLNNR
jgi:hypothetical protein